MAYDHDMDLPDDYSLGQAVTIIESPHHREVWHRKAQRDNFLNIIGHEAVMSSLYRMGGPVDSELGGVGATIYEVATLPEIMNINPVDVPSYHDTDGMSVAMRTALSLDRLSDLDVMSMSRAAVDVMEEDSPVLHGLVHSTSRNILGGSSDKELIRRVVAGAALMRVLQKTAYFDVTGQSFEDN